MHSYKSVIKSLFALGCTIAVTSVIAEKQEDQDKRQRIADRYKDRIGQTYWYYPDRCTTMPILDEIISYSPAIKISAPFQLTIDNVVLDKELIDTYLQVRLTNSKVGYIRLIGKFTYETNPLTESEAGHGTLACLSINSPETIANAPAVAAKAKAKNLEAQDAGNQRLKSQDSHSYQLPTSDVKVFDAIVMGLWTMKDIDKIASKPQFSTSLCSIRNKCEYKNIEASEYGILGDNFYSTDMGNMPLSFAKFELQGQHFDASFYEGLIVELRVKGSSYLDEIDESLVKELRPSFDKKYKKLKTISKKEKSNYSTYTYTFESWADRSGAFEVQLKNTRKVLEIPEHRCLGLLSVLKAAGIGTAHAEWECNKVTDNVPVYTLAYRKRVANTG